MTDDTTHRREWTVTGMDCAGCTAKVVRAVERMPGVRAARVALMAKRLSVDLDPGITRSDQIEAVVRALGYGIAPTVAMTCPNRRSAPRRVRNRRGTGRPRGGW